MKIGNVTINGPAVLAPMAGVADRAFRELCVSFGASYVVSEMVSAKGLEYHNQKTGELMELSGDVGGKRVVVAHRGDVAVMKVEDGREMVDVDFADGRR